MTERYSGRRMRTLTATIAVLTACASICLAQVQTAKHGGLIGDQEFGYAVAIDGQVAIVGVPHDDQYGEDAGVAYVYRRAVAGWVLHAELAPDDLAAGDRFGFAVDVSGRQVVIGAPGDDARGYRAGAAYVYEFDQVAREWVLVREKLLAFDGGQSDQFGYRVAIDGPWIAIGAPYNDDGGADIGAAYVLTLSPDPWDPSIPDSAWDQQKLSREGDGAPGDEFGCSVDIDGRLIVVGAWKDDDDGMDSGSAYTFFRPGSSPHWDPLGKILPDELGPRAFQGFGDSVAVSLSSARILVGATYDGQQGPASGAAYVFHYDQPLTLAPPAGGWTQEGKLLSTTPNWGDHFGWSVALSDGVALVGAWSDEVGGPQSGAAHTFLWGGSEWTAGPVIYPDDPIGGAFFGHCVAITPGGAIIGAPFATNLLGDRSGAIYFYDLPWGVTFQGPRKAVIEAKTSP